MLFEVDGVKLATPLQMFRAVYPDKARQRMEGHQALVEGGWTAMTNLFQVSDKLPNDLGVNLG